MSDRYHTPDDVPDEVPDIGYEVWHIYTQHMQAREERQQSVVDALRREAAMMEHIRDSMQAELEALLEAAEAQRGNLSDAAAKVLDEALAFVREQRGGEL